MSVSKVSKELDFEINLIPFISLLSALICSLLLTATIISIGSMKVKHAVGGQSLSETAKTPVVWVQMDTDGTLTLLLKDAVGKVASQFKSRRVKSHLGEIDWIQFEKNLNEVKELVPELESVLIQPQAQSVYEQIINLMDLCKKMGMSNLGIAPI